MALQIGTSHSSSEEELLGRARTGDEEAFALLIQPYRGSLQRAANHYAHCPAVAEDAVQEALLKAWRAIRTFRGGSKLSTWLIRIAINEVKMILRRSDQRRLEYHDDLPALERTLGRSLPTAWSDTAENSLLQSERTATLERAIRHLPKSLRCVLEQELNDNNVEATAQNLGLSASAVKSRRLRARNELKRRIGSELLMAR